jgi:predicted SAM-dependent methyltransferase
MLKINIGCGHTNFGEDWEHIDNIDEPHIKSHDITKLPYEDNSVDILYSSHTLEYFDREEAIEVLREWYRVLRMGGKAYISVPDFWTMSELYYKNNIPLHKLLGPLYGKIDSNGNIIYHKTVWDYQSLGDYLRMVGFRRIDKWSIGDEYSLGERKNIDFDTYNDCSNAEINGNKISLNIVAEKNEYEGKK